MSAELYLSASLRHTYTYTNCNLSVPINWQEAKLAEMRKMGIYVRGSQSNLQGNACFSKNIYILHCSIKNITD